MSILGVDYFAAKRLVELYESLTDCAARAIEQRRSKLANGLNALLNADAADYIEAQRVVAEYDREETERVTRRMQGHAATQLMLAPRPRPQVL
jgi:hypothetical protein